MTGSGALVIAAPAVCCDETPVRAGPGPGWRRRRLLVAATPLLTYYRLGDRTRASFAGFVLPGLAGLMVHDRFEPDILAACLAWVLLRGIRRAAPALYRRSTTALPMARRLGYESRHHNMMEESECRSST